ncbi:tyrosine-type recombinase/integrase [Arthrobacter sp. HLT1-21]
MKPLLAPIQWEDAIAPWTEWLRAAGRPKTTIYLRTVQLRRLGRFHAKLSPWDLSAGELVAWIGSHNWDSDTIRSHRAALRSFYAWGLLGGMVEVNPAAGLPSVKAKAGRPKPAQESQWKDAMLSSDPRDALMIRLGAEAGLRCCEICKVHTDDVEHDLIGYSLRVVGKGGKVRTVPLSPRLALELRARPAGYAFKGAVDGHLSAAYVSKRLSWALGKGTTGHMLRHRFASVAYSAERDLRAVQELLGHSSPETTARYTAIPDGALRAAVLAAAS